MKKLFLMASLVLSNCLFSADTHILMVRHGETDWNLGEKVQGHSDIPLNATGKAQAKELAEKMIAHHPDISAIYSSDLDRAYTTALETAKKFGLSVEKKESFREINCGEAEGKLIKNRVSDYKDVEKKLEEKYPDKKERWNHTCIPGAESQNELLQRTKKELLTLAKVHEGKKIAVYSHSGPIRRLIIDLIDAEDFARLNNCEIAHFIYSSETDTLKFVKIEKMIP